MTMTPESLRSRFCAAFHGIRQGIQGVVAIDGKAVRGAYQRGARTSPLHLVNVWAAAARMVIGL